MAKILFRWVKKVPLRVFMGLLLLFVWSGCGSQGDHESATDMQTLSAETTDVIDPPTIASNESENGNRAQADDSGGFFTLIDAGSSQDITLGVQSPEGVSGSSGTEHSPAWVLEIAQTENATSDIRIQRIAVSEQFEITHDCLNGLPCEIQIVLRGSSETQNSELLGQLVVTLEKEGSTIEATYSFVIGQKGIGETQAVQTVPTEPSSPVEPSAQPQPQVLPETVASAEASASSVSSSTQNLAPASTSTPSLSSSNTAGTTVSMAAGYAAGAATSTAVSTPTTVGYVIAFVPGDQGAGIKADTLNNVVLIAVDSDGNRMENYVGTATLNSTDQFAWLMNDKTVTFDVVNAGMEIFYDNGIFVTPGTHTVTATDVANPGITSSVQVQVVPGNPRSMTITGGGSNQTIAVGSSPLPITVVVKDSVQNGVGGVTVKVVITNHDPIYVQTNNTGQAIVTINPINTTGSYTMTVSVPAWLRLGNRSYAITVE